MTVLARCGRHFDLVASDEMYLQLHPSSRTGPSSVVGGGTRGCICTWVQLNQLRGRRRDGAWTRLFTSAIAFLLVSTCARRFREGPSRTWKLRCCSCAIHVVVVVAVRGRRPHPSRPPTFRGALGRVRRTWRARSCRRRLGRTLRELDAWSKLPSGQRQRTWFGRPGSVPDPSPWRAHAALGKAEDTKVLRRRHPHACVGQLARRSARRGDLDPRREDPLAGRTSVLGPLANHRDALSRRGGTWHGQEFRVHAAGRSHARLKQTGAGGNRTVRAPCLLRTKVKGTISANGRVRGEIKNGKTTAGGRPIFRWNGSDRRQWRAATCREA